MAALTILVCVRDDWRVLRLLESLQRQTAPFDSFRAIVVNTGREGYGDCLHGFDFNVVTVKSDGHRLAAGRNVGLAQVETELVLTTDADCVAAPDLVAETIAAFNRADQDVAGIGGAIEKYAFDTPTRRHGITINDGQMALQYLPASPLPYITGAHAAFRSASLRAVGGYDERFWCGEDVDICYRLGIAGRSLEINPKARIMHEDRASVAEHFKRFRWYAVDQALLFKMYRGERGRRGCLNRYPWRRLGASLGHLRRGLPALMWGTALGSRRPG